MQRSETNIVHSTRTHICVIALGVLWHWWLWSGVTWIFYCVMPAHKEILHDFEIDNPPFVESVISVSDFIVIHSHFVPVFFIAVLLADSVVSWLLRRKPIGRMLWFLLMSAVPFFTFVYGVFGVCTAFEFMAIQLAFEAAR